MFETLPGFRDFPPEACARRIIFFGFSEPSPAPFISPNMMPPYLNLSICMWKNQGKRLSVSSFTSRIRATGESPFDLNSLPPLPEWLRQRQTPCQSQLNGIISGSISGTNDPKKAEAAHFINLMLTSSEKLTYKLMPN